MCKVYGNGRIIIDGLTVERYCGSCLAIGQVLILCPSIKGPLNHYHSSLSSVVPSGFQMRNRVHKCIHTVRFGEVTQQSPALLLGRQVVRLLLECILQSDQRAQCYLDWLRFTIIHSWPHPIQANACFYCTNFKVFCLVGWLLGWVVN